MTGWADAVAAAATVTFTLAFALMVLYSVDDLLVLGAFLVRDAAGPRRYGGALTSARLAGDPEQRVAVLVPAWDESDVIRRMLLAMLARYDYRDYRVFVGVYPNDAATRTEVEAVAAADARIACVVVARPGPTTKGDCLNQLYHAALRDAAVSARPFDVFVLNDAEDVVPPLGLRVVNRFSPAFDVVQLPVLPLRVHWSHLTAWHYADEFAVAHGRDMPVRAWLAGAVPSAGVGTGFSRRALALASDLHGGLPFSLTSLTEDYDLTMRLAGAGCRMTFVDEALFRPREDRTGRPIDDAIAVREYFPKTFRRAVRQKSRWIAGIVFQGWAELGWKGNAVQLFFLYRDRKIVYGYFAVLLGYVSIALAAAARALTGTPVNVVPPGPWGSVLADAFLALTILFLAVRAAFVAAVYGWVQAAWSPVRAVWGSVINLLAAARAVHVASARGRPRWDKTAHEFPDDVTV
jgi:adsorption protein B